MRTKSVCVKPRYSKSPQKPSLFTKRRSVPLHHPDDGGGVNYMCETSSKIDGDDDDDNAAHFSGDDGNVRKKKNSMDLDAEECLACNHGEDLLVCCEIGCPVSIHEKCAQFTPKFDGLGRFCCPYCSYKREFARAKELREKAMLAKKRLSDFIDSRLLVGEPSGKEKRGDGKEVEFDDAEVQNQDVEMEDICQDDEDGVLVSDCNHHGVMIEDEMGDVPSTVDGSNAARQSEEEKTTGEEGKPEKPEDDPVLDGGEQAEYPDDGDHVEIPDGGMQAENSDQEGKKEQDKDVRIHDDGKQTEPLKVHYIEEEQEEMHQDVHDDEEQGQCENEEHVLCDESEANSDGGEEEQEEMHRDVYDDEEQGKCEEEEHVHCGESEAISDGEEGEQEEMHQDVYDYEEQGQSEEEHVHCDEPEANSDGGVSAHKVPGITDLDTEKSVVRQRRVKHLARKKPARPRYDKSSTKAPTQPHTTLEKEAATKKRDASSKSSRKSRNSRQPQLCPQGYEKLFLNDKRKRKHWRPDEEDTLEEGVAKYSAANKNVPWRKILEFGRNIFDSSRTPTDLKDKWKNMKAKRQSE